MATLTLWRGTRRLGVLHERASSTSQQLAAVLLPDADADALSSVSQVRPPIPPIAGFAEAVMQWPEEPDLVAERSTRATRSARAARTTPGPVALQRVAPGTPRGVPPSEQFEVRTPEGAALPVRQLTLLEYRPDPSDPDPELATCPPGSIIDGSVWLVSARLEGST
jgi:hypothetical protein